MKNLVPYQLFFPLGLLSGLLAVLVWLLQPLALLSSPALFIHSKLIAGGFLWSFIVGFLMTAVPRMTRGRHAAVAEKVVALLLVVSMIYQSFLLDGSWFYRTHILLILFLLLFVARRLFERTKPLPVFFSHVGLALLSCLLGCYYMIQGNSYMGIHLYHVGTVLLLVLGIGTRFFSFLSALPSSFETPHRGAHFVFHLHGAAVLAMLFFAGLGQPLGYLGLGFLGLSYLVFVWKVQRPTRHPSPLKWAMRLVAATIPFTFFLSWMQPAQFVTWLHLLFVGGFAMITLSVATRVTLAHGAYPTSLEASLKSLRWSVGFMALSMMARVAYGLTFPPVKVHLLQLAACLWILALLVWCYGLFVKIFLPGPQSRPTCQ